MNDEAVEDAIKQIAKLSNEMLDGWKDRKAIDLYRLGKIEGLTSTLVRTISFQRQLADQR